MSAQEPPWRWDRAGILAMSIVLLLLAAFVAAACGLFFMDVPLALETSASSAGLTIRKAILRTGVTGVGFVAGYLIAAIASLRHLFGGRTCVNASSSSA